MPPCLSRAADVATTTFCQQSLLDERWTNWSSPTQDNTMTNLTILEEKQCEVLSGGTTLYVYKTKNSYNTTNSYNFWNNKNSLNGSGVYAIGSTLG